MGHGTSTVAAACLLAAPLVAAASANSQNVAYPDLGRDAPVIAVVFNAADDTATYAAIYVLEEGQWSLVHQGAYKRGSLLAGKGGQGDRFRLITVEEGFADLVFAEGELVLIIAGETKLL